MNAHDESTVLIDASNGYESVAEAFIAARTRSRIGAETVSEWAKQLPPGGAVLDIGCGHGIPVTESLIQAGFAIYGVDASRKMTDAFRARFPSAALECCTAERSEFFRRSFDGVIAWGLMFLLPPAAQAQLIQKVSSALDRGGRFLFTAPRQSCEWPDSLTGATSRSLGAETYHRLLRAAGLVPVGETDDEGENHYYFSVKS